MKLQPRSRLINIHTKRIPHLHRLACPSHLPRIRHPMKTNRQSMFNLATRRLPRPRSLSSQLPIKIKAVLLARLKYVPPPNRPSKSPQCIRLNSRFFKLAVPHLRRNEHVTLEFSANGLGVNGFGQSETAGVAEDDVQFFGEELGDGAGGGTGFEEVVDVAFDADGIEFGGEETAAGTGGGASGGEG